MLRRPCAGPVVPSSHSGADGVATIPDAVPARSPSLILAGRLALGMPALLIAGAYISQYAFGLYPCEMCWWQRYPHFAAIALAFLATLIPAKRALIALAALAMFVSGLIGLYHMGVEWRWWDGLSACTANFATGGGDPLDAIINAPLIRCDEAQWRFLGVSLAGWNFAFSTLAAIAIVVLLHRSRKGVP